MPPLPADLVCNNIGKVCDKLHKVGSNLRGTQIGGCGEVTGCTKENPINCKTTSGGDTYDMWCNDDCESGGGIETGCGGNGTVNPQCYKDSVTKKVCKKLI